MKIGIIGAMEQEVELLRAQLEQVETKTIAGYDLGGGNDVPRCCCAFRARLDQIFHCLRVLVEVLGEVNLGSGQHQTWCGTA